MKSFLVLIMTLVHSTFALADFTNRFNSCGDYLLRGLVHEENAHYSLLIGVGSKSERKIAFDTSMNKYLLLKKNKNIDVLIDIRKKTNIDDYVILSKNIENTIPDKSLLSRDGIKLIKEKICQN